MWNPEDVEITTQEEKLNENKIYAALDSGGSACLRVCIYSKAHKCLYVYVWSNFILCASVFLCSKNVWIWTGFMVVAASSNLFEFYIKPIKIR